MSGVLWQTRWQSLGELPEAATAFVAADDHAVTVRTASGRLYSCAENEGADCWRQLAAGEAVPREATQEPCESFEQIEIPAPPGQVVERRSWEVCYADAAMFVEYVRLSDGTIWRWERFVSAYLGLGAFTLTLLCGGVLGAVVGLLLGILLLRVMGRRLRAMAP